MNVSPRGLYALASHEGIVPGPYRDSVGVWTYGVGHTAAAGEPNPRKMARGMPDDLDGEIARALRTYIVDIERYAADVRRAVRVKVSQEQFDALVSFHYNTGGIARAELTKHLNAGRVASAARTFMGWLKPIEVRARREAEQRLFRDGTYPRDPVPVWGVDASGRVQWRAVKRIAQAEFLALLEQHKEIRP